MKAYSKQLICLGYINLRVRFLGCDTATINEEYILYIFF